MQAHQQTVTIAMQIATVLKIEQNIKRTHKAVLKWFDTKILHAELSAIPVADARLECLLIADHIRRSSDVFFTYCEYYQASYQYQPSGYNKFLKNYTQDASKPERRWRRCGRTPKREQS